MYSYAVQGHLEDPPVESFRPARRLGFLFLLGLSACLGYWAVEVYLLSGHLGFPLDDSWIHLQFARSMARGSGLSVNPGELVPGSTAPLWTGLLSIWFLMPGGALLAAKLLGIALYLAGGWATYELGREMGLTARLSQLATALSLITSWLVWSALSGLEIPLFILLSLIGMRLHIRERSNSEGPPLSLAVLALSTLARPEAILLFGLACVDRLLHFERRHGEELSWRPPRPAFLFSALVILAVVLAPVMLFNLWASGSLLPTTFGAKSGGLARWLPELKYLYTVFGIFFQVQPVMALLAGAGVLSLLGSLGSDDDRGLLPALWVVALPLAYGLIDPAGSFNLVGNFGRYFFPLFPVVVLLGALGIQRYAVPVGSKVSAGPVAGRVRVLLLLIIFVPTLVELFQGAARYGQNVVNVQDSDVRVARWLSARLPPQAVLGVADIGALSFNLSNRVVDLAGIASPEFRSMDMPSFFDRHRPDYLVIFTNWFQRLSLKEELFPVIREFPIDNNITMGGDTIAIYATPWTRHPLLELEPDLLGD